VLLLVPQPAGEDDEENITGCENYDDEEGQEQEYEL
jgi:hypothetical protein